MDLNLDTKAKKLKIMLKPVYDKLKNKIYEVQVLDQLRRKTSFSKKGIIEVAKCKRS